MASTSGVQRSVDASFKMLETAGASVESAGSQLGDLVGPTKPRRRPAKRNTTMFFSELASMGMESGAPADGSLVGQLSYLQASVDVFYVHAYNAIRYLVHRDNIRIP